ncbi:hypothetical protein MJH12_03550, partial [bacterium]|nr:hypothetical protein [bacterium]
MIKEHLTESGYGYYNESEFKKNFDFSYIELENEYFLFLYKLKNSHQYEFVILMLDVSFSDTQPIWFGKDLSKKTNRDQSIRAASYLFVYSHLCNWDLSPQEIQIQYDLAHESIQKQNRQNTQFLYMVDNYQYSNRIESVEIEVQNVQTSHTDTKQSDFISDFELSSHGFLVESTKIKQEAKLALSIDEHCNIKGFLYTQNRKLLPITAKQLENYQISNISQGMQSLWENHFSSIQEKSYLKIKNEQFQHLIQHLLIEILDELDHQLIYFEQGTKKL